MPKKKCPKCRIRKTSKRICFFCVNGNSQCHYCQIKKDLTKDHILPKSRGGQNCRKNYQALCQNCNLMKGRHTDDEIAGIFRDIKKYGVQYDWEKPFEKHLKRIEHSRREPLNW